MFNIDKAFPSFLLETYFPEKGTTGKISPKELSGKWAVFVFYPADFTFVCPTELADMARLYPEFKKRETEVIGVSTDTVYTHKGWLDTEELLKDVTYPMAEDHTGSLARELGVLYEESGKAQRATFIIDPDGILRAAEVVADAIGRNGAETLRKLKALQFARSHGGKVCPAAWEEGDATLSPGIQAAGHVAQQLKK